MPWTPIRPPINPPARRYKPILKSTFPTFQWAYVPDVDAATIWFESVAAATVAGIPNIINNGVIKKPPPTPNRPESRPTTSPRPMGIKMLMLVNATGK